MLTQVINKEELKKLYMGRRESKAFKRWAV
jgi:hypothetical protein